MFQSKPPPCFCAHAHQQPSNPRQNHAPTPVLPLNRSRRCAPARPAARSLPLSSSLFSSSISSVTTSLRHLSHHRSRPHPTSSLHHLLPVPGPDPARLPLWWLGGVRARHRPQTPIATRVGCGRRIDAAVHTSIRTLAVGFVPRRHWAAVSAGLGGGPDQDLVQRHAPWP